MTLDEFITAHEMLPQLQLVAFMAGWALALLFGLFVRSLV